MSGLLSRHPRLQKIVSTKTGAVRHLHRLTVTSADPDINCFFAEPANSATFSNFMAGDRNSGAGIDEVSAVWATIGEFFERYCSSFLGRHEVRFCKAAELDAESLEPASFALFSDDQLAQADFAFSRITRDTPISWVRAESLADKGTVYVPAQLTFMPFEPAQDEPYIAPQLSHGLACASSVEAATCYALLELIERDAFSLFWLAQRSRPGATVSAQSTDELSMEIRRAVGERYFLRNMSYMVYDIISDVGVPTYFVVARSDTDNGALITVGAAARLDHKAALRKAFLETAQARPYIRLIRDTEPDWRADDGFTNIRSFEDHAKLFSFYPHLLERTPALLPAAGLLPHFARNVETSQPREMLRQVVERLLERGISPAMVDLTTGDAADVGLFVVRGFAPGLHPLHGDHLLPFLGGERISNHLGKDFVLTPEKWLDRATPHPFP